MPQFKTIVTVCLMASWVGISSAVGAAPAPATSPATRPVAAAPAVRNKLPRTQDYQRTLCEYMATLTEKDFDHGVTEKITVPPVNPDKEYQYRHYILAMQQGPHVGGKRGIGAVNSPPLNYLLSTIEGGRNGVIVPPVWVESLGTFIAWDSAGNLYRDNKALKMRAFVAGAVKLMMLDNHLDENAGSAITRADWNGYSLITSACSYPVFKGVLPAPVQKAYEAGLIRLARKLIAKGPSGAEPDYEMSAALGVWYVGRATGDPEIASQAEAYAKRLCTDPRFFHPAGYWVEGGGLDVGFGGMPNFWTVWLALATDWRFAKETVAKAYRLKAHLVLPEPDGTTTGPSAFNNRLGSPASEDQWDWDRSREHAAAMVTDEAAHMVVGPSDEDLPLSVERRTQIVSSHLYGGLKNAPRRKADGVRDGYLTNEELRGSPWVWRIFTNGFNHPVEVSPGYEFYRPGAYAHLAKLRQENAPLRKSPYLRDERFVRDFGGAFVAARRAKFAAIVHLGPVGDPAPDEPMAFYNGKLGFGGGQLSAFWTPGSGAAILGRRSGFAMRGTEPMEYDKLEQWRLWPIHAVSGITSEGKVFTSGRITRPAVTSDVKADRAEVKVSGVVPAKLHGQEGGLSGQLQYARAFTIDDQGVRVETTVSGDGKDPIAELYETLPVYHRDSKHQPKAESAKIEFKSGGPWAAATDAWQANVQSVRITRFGGSVTLTFEKPQRVKLSPADWTDTFLTRASCRNVMIDLLNSDDKRAGVKQARTVAYRVACE